MIESGYAHLLGKMHARRLGFTVQGMVLTDPQQDSLTLARVGSEKNVRTLVIIQGKLVL